MMSEYAGKACLGHIFDRVSFCERSAYPLLGDPYGYREQAGGGLSAAFLNLSPLHFLSKQQMTHYPHLPPYGINSGGHLFAQLPEPAFHIFQLTGDSPKSVYTIAVRREVRGEAGV